MMLHIAEDGIILEKVFVLYRKHIDMKGTYFVLLGVYNNKEVAEKMRDEATSLYYMVELEEILLNGGISHESQ